MQKILVSCVRYTHSVLCNYPCLLAYAVSKYGVTLAVLGMSQEFKPDGIAVNALWPRTGTNVNVCRIYLQYNTKILTYIAIPCYLYIQQ